jgi:excisionase family DNA binding protein
VLALRDVSAPAGPGAVTDCSSTAALVSDVGQIVSPTRRLLDADDVAIWLAIPKAAVYRLVREGKLRSVDIGRFRRFDPSTVERFIAGGGVGLSER